MYCYRQDEEEEDEAECTCGHCGGYSDDINRFGGWTAAPRLPAAAAVATAAPLRGRRVMMPGASRGVGAAYRNAMSNGPAAAAAAAATVSAPVRRSNSAPAVTRPAPRTTVSASSAATRSASTAGLNSSAGSKRRKN